jgi:hypothetical protein
MPDIFFSHRSQEPLKIQTGANQISWGYGLNHSTYPTYGGEVVQILSAYTDDLTIEGEVSSYAEMEAIYEWFLSYMQQATQGGNYKSGHFDPSTITFSYPTRGWEQQITVTELPGLRYARDLVLPQYQIKAHVVESHGDLTDAIIDQVHNAALKGAGLDLTDFGRVTAGIGFVKANPFSDPFPGQDIKEIDAKTRENFQKLGDYFGTIIDTYMSGDFSSLAVDYGSAPAFLRGGTGAKDTATNEVGEAIKAKEKK